VASLSRQLGRLVAFALPILGACEIMSEPPRVATSITITPATTIPLAAIGATRQLTATVKDQNGDTLANARVVWTTSNAALVAVNATGLATAVAIGSAQITATSGSVNASVTIAVEQMAAQLVKVSGDSQTATVGRALTQPIVVQVNDAGGHAVAGVTVGFAAAAGSGSVGSASITTNALGRAQSSWTLGSTAGSVSASATVAGAGISGNPTTFTAIAVAPPVLVRVATGLNSALYVTAPPGDTTRIFVVQQTGAIRVLRRDTLLTSPFLDLSGIISCCGERGLLSLAFHPSYGSNGRFYVDYTDTTGALTVARYRVSADPNVADAASGEVLLTIPHATYANHNGGFVTFGPDGYLYVGTGDGGGGGDPFRSGQDSTVLLGKILRIDVDGAFPYAIPPTNPFAGRAPAAPEVWAYGLRNPWRFSFDRGTGDFYIGDVGQNLWEEIDFAPAGDRGGHNYGWSTMEGLHCYNPSSGCVMSGLVLPVYEYGHGTDCSVTGGYVYRGTRQPALAGRYFFGEYCGGWVRSLRMQGGVATELVDHTPQFGTKTGITSFGEDGRGELYITRDNGEVYRIAPQ
jgi:hypothetical protein